MARPHTSLPEPSAARPLPIRRALGLAFGVLCLYLAFRGVDRAELGRLIRGASPLLLMAAGILSLLMSAVKCTKIGILLKSVCPFRYRVLFAAEMVSILVDIVFPLRLQELVKAYLIGRGEHLPASFVFGAEVVEKCMELVCLLAVLFLLSAWRPLPDTVTLAVRVTAGLCAAIVVALVIIVARPALNDNLRRRIDRTPIPGIQRVGRWLHHILGGIREAAVRPPSLFWILLVTLVEWTLLGAAMWLAAKAVGTALTPPQLLGVLAFNMIAFALPTSTSGSIGMYELAGTMTLVLVFGFSRERALAVTLALHVVLVGFGVLGGLVGLHMVHLGLREVRRKAEDPAARMAVENP